MAQFSDQYAKAYNTKPASKLEPRELNGRVRRLSAEITLGAEILTTAQVVMAKLPANAVIIEARLIAPGGTGGTLNLGWAAGENEVADDNGIFAAIAGNSAVDVTFDMSSATAAKNKKFSEEVDIELSASVDSVGWNGDLVELEIAYIID